MGCKYTVEAYYDQGFPWGRGHTSNMVWQGQHFIPALWNLFKAKRKYGNASLRWGQ